MPEATKEIKKRLEYLRGELKAERMSYDELHELQSYAALIDDGDVELLEAAGVAEFSKRTSTKELVKQIAATLEEMNVDYLQKLAEEILHKKVKFIGYATFEVSEQD